MPTVICDYCSYVGQGADYEDMIVDVENHEEECKERPEGE